LVIFALDISIENIKFLMSDCKKTQNENGKIGKIYSGEKKKAPENSSTPRYPDCEENC
jgi:hypothetical protein